MIHVIVVVVTVCDCVVVISLSECIIVHMHKA